MNPMDEACKGKIKETMNAMDCKCKNTLRATYNPMDSSCEGNFADSGTLDTVNPMDADCFGSTARSKRSETTTNYMDSGCYTTPTTNPADTGCTAVDADGDGKHTLKDVITILKELVGM
jgi:hypothetical protein